MAECVKCGFCCTRGPCVFGEWDEMAHRCVYLTEGNLCAIHDAILAMPGSEINPAFGAGCSSSLFNDMRDTAIRRNHGLGLERHEGSVDVVQA